MKVASRQPSQRRLRGGWLAGHALVEAMITLLVVGLGTLALLYLNSSLARDGDTARQRSEAVRLAAARMERLRSHVATAPGADRWQAAPVGDESATGSSGTFHTHATLDGAADDAFRAATVVVRWSGRDATLQELRLGSVIALTDPMAIAAIGNPWAASAAALRPAPGAPHPALPRAAIDLGDGRHALRFDPEQVLVVDSRSAEPLLMCRVDAASADAARIRSAIAAGDCAAIGGRLLAGYIGRSARDLPWPTGINHDALTRNAASARPIACSLSEPLQSAYADAAAAVDHRHYVCTIPLEAPHTWGGTLRLGGLPTDGDLVVCRYQYTAAGLTDGARNVQPYVGVRQSLHAQNYLLVAAANRACPASMDRDGVATGVVHQDCRIDAADPRGACPERSP